MTQAMRYRLILVAIIVVYGVMYARTIDYAYVWDDVHTLQTSDFFDRPISEQLRVTEMQRIDPSVPSLRGIAPAHESYRPLTLLDQDIDVKLFGRGDPRPMHVHNLILGALTILLVFALARRLLADVPNALAVAAVFALHPLHAEPFAYISARADLVSGLLALASLLLIVEQSPLDGNERSPRGRAMLGLFAALLYIGALFAKESAIALPLVAFGFAAALRRIRAWAPALVAVTASVGIYLMLRHALIPQATAATSPQLASDAILALPSLALQYAGTLLLPFDISIARPPRVPLAFGWAAVVVTALGLVIAMLRGKLGPRLGTALAGLVAMVLLIGPSAVAVATLGALADRYVYIAMLGPTIAGVLAVRALIDRGGLVRRIALGVVAIWTALIVFVTVREIPAWESNETLYGHAVAVEPASGLARFHVAMLRFADGNWEDAAALLEGAAEVAPTNERVLNNLAVCYMNLGRDHDAEPLLHRILALTGGMTFRPWYNLGAIELHRGHVREACAAFQRALAINPQYTVARSTYARACTQRP